MLHDKYAKYFSDMKKCLLPTKEQRLLQYFIATVHSTMKQHKQRN